MLVGMQVFRPSAPPVSLGGWPTAKRRSGEDLAEQDAATGFRPSLRRSSGSHELIGMDPKPILRIVKRRRARIPVEALARKRHALP